MFKSVPPSVRLFPPLGTSSRRDTQLPGSACFQRAGEGILPARTSQLRLRLISVVKKEAFVVAKCGDQHAKFVRFSESVDGRNFCCYNLQTRTRLFEEGRLEGGHLC